MPSLASRASYSSALARVISPFPMKRCPRVRLVDSRPSTFPGTVREPCSITSPCTGRTNCASPAPQRMTFGIGNDLSASSTAGARTSASALPLIFERATTTSPLGVARRSSDATLTPCFFANPSIACAGAFAEGPVTSVSRSWPAAETSGTRTARRRGVAYAFELRPASPALASSPARRSAKACDRARSDFGGSSSVRISTSRFSGMRQHREAEPLARLVVGLGHGTRQRAHAADIRLALGDRDRAARIQQVEGVRGLHHHLVARQHALRLDQALRLGFVVTEMPEQHVGVRELEVVFRLLDFVLMVDVAIGHPVRPHEVEYAVLALQVHGEALEAVGDLAEDRFAG